MKLVLFLARESWKLLLLATIAGTLSGVSGAYLAKLVSDAILGGEKANLGAILFFAICIAYASLKSCS